jgi:hypothetical protein
MRTIIAAAMLALATSPALAYSNVSPKPGVPVPQKATTQKSCFTRFECIEAPLWTMPQKVTVMQRSLRSFSTFSVTDKKSSAH